MFKKFDFWIFNKQYKNNTYYNKERMALSNDFIEFISKKLGNVNTDHEVEIGFDKRLPISLRLAQKLIMAHRARVSKNKNYKLLLNNTLDINYNYDHKKLNSYRITISGKDDIESVVAKYANKENVYIFKSLVTDNNYEIINKQKDLQNMMDDKNNPLRFRLSKEAKLDKKETSQLYDITYTENDHINFRYKQRMSLIVFEDDNVIIRTDITSVISSQKIKGIYNNKNTYELEVELVCKRPQKPLKDTYIQKLLNEVTYQMKIIQESEVPIADSENKQVLEKLFSLTNVKNAKDSKDLPGMQSFSAEIIHIVDMIPNKYSVTDKADGERHFLLVHNDNIYLISNNLEIKKLHESEYNKKYISTYNDTILDGEYLYIPKYKKILFLSFDILVKSGTDLRNEANLKKRYEHMLEVTSKLFTQKYVPEQYKGEFNLNKINSYYEKDLRAYMKSLNTQLENNIKHVVLSKYFIFPTGGSSSEIFAHSSLIWSLYTKDKDFNCPYILDGLIYTPLEQKYTTVAREVIKPILKWKPSSKNSIDFYVMFEKDKENNQIINVFDNAVNKFIEQVEDDEYESMDSYKVKDKVYQILNLYVGRSENKQEIPVLFQSDKKNYIANIYLDKDNKPRSIDGNIILDKTVVEFAYNNDPSIEPEFRWVPLRTRMDKTDMVLTQGRKYGNYETIANKVWQSIMDSIEISDIELLSNEATYNNKMKELRAKISNVDIIAVRSMDKYYKEITNLGESMRNFHNFIKSTLIYTYCSLLSKNKKMDVFDIACGRGGDINKFYHARAGSYVGINVNSGDIYSASDGAISRYNHMKSTKPNVLPMKFLVADATVPLNFSDQEKAIGSMTDQNKTLMIEIFGENASSKNYKTYDIINCQFALHYFLENETTWNNFCNNVKKTLRPDGFVIITTFDGELLHNSFDKDGSIVGYYTTEDGRKKTFFDIKRKYDDKVKDIKRTGLQIDVNMAWVQSDAYIPEYLVSSEFLIDEFKKKCNLTLIESKTFGFLRELYKDFFTNTYSYESNIKTRNFLERTSKFYKNTNDEVINSSQQFSRLSRYYVFQLLK